MVVGNVTGVDRVLELTFDGGQKRQFRVGDIVDINFYDKDFNFRLRAFERGVTGKIRDIADNEIIIDNSTLFHSDLIPIEIKNIVAIDDADSTHIEDMRMR